MPSSCFIHHELNCEFVSGRIQAAAATTAAATITTTSIELKQAHQTASQSASQPADLAPTETTTAAATLDQQLHQRRRMTFTAVVSAVLAVFRKRIVSSVGLMYFWSRF